MKMKIQIKKALTDFETDKRLNQIFIQNYLSVKCTRLFTTIHNNYQVPIRISAEDIEMSMRDIVFYGKGKSLRVGMDAIACLWNATWELDIKKEYLFSVDPLWEGKIYNHGNNSEADLAEAFINDADNLPKNLRDKLYSPSNSNDYPQKSGLSADQIPDAMYQQLLDIANIKHNASVVGLPKNSYIKSPSSIPRDKVRTWLIKDPKKSYNTYNMKIFGGEFSISMTVSDVKKKKKEHDNAKKNGKNFTVYRTERNEVSHKEAEKILELKQLVEIHMQYAYLPDVLKYLAEKYNVPLVGHNRSLLPQRINKVDIPKMPLHQVLDHLTTLYGNTEWEWREMGMLVVRKKSRLDSR
jgi:hypothetical protein